MKNLKSCPHFSLSLGTDPRPAVWAWESSFQIMSPNLTSQRREQERVRTSKLLPRRHCGQDQRLQLAAPPGTVPSTSEFTCYAMQPLGPATQMCSPTVQCLFLKLGICTFSYPTNLSTYQSPVRDSPCTGSGTFFLYLKCILYNSFIPSFFLVFCFNFFLCQRSNPVPLACYTSILLLSYVPSMTSSLMVLFQLLKYSSSLKDNPCVFCSTFIWRTVRQLFQYLVQFQARFR